MRTGAHTLLPDYCSTNTSTDPKHFDPHKLMDMCLAHFQVSHYVGTPTLTQCWNFGVLASVKRCELNENDDHSLITELVKGKKWSLLVQLSTSRDSYSSSSGTLRTIIMLILKITTSRNLRACCEWMSKVKCTKEEITFRLHWTFSERNFLRHVYGTVCR